MPERSKSRKSTEKLEVSQRKGSERGVNHLTRFLTSETASEIGKLDRSRCHCFLKWSCRGLESGGLSLTWLDHQGRVSHVDVTAPGETDRGPGHGDSD
ncbi:hypothetical protein F2Q69_00048285 [Brassica cretica]|uniref:Uncharacterized protein n=1 Tax=Brassica cretica TaxID=69181 RepID=A0A8S9Q7L1_BRACR|nr:hypothetical protein F2Q69_00048285 [Brassica cretica]